MKKLLFVFCLLFGAAVAVNAQDTTKAQDPITDTTATQDQSDQYRTDDADDMDLADDKDRKEITVAELPAAISDKLQGQDYSGWIVDKVYSKEKDGETMYAVELKKDDEMKKVKFDAQGNVIKEKDKKDGDQK
jgi:hypothetical protein